MFSKGGNNGGDMGGGLMGLATALLSVFALACDAPVKPEREWTPADHQQSAEPDPLRQASTPSAPEQGGAARAAQALWNVSCAGCHGRGGRGDGPTPPPGAQLPDLTRADFQAARTDAQLAEVIRNGRSLMPAFATKLGPEAIDALVAHVRALGGVAPAPSPAGAAAAGAAE